MPPPLLPAFLARLLTGRRSDPGPPRPPVPLVLYTRAVCPLCDELLEELERARIDEPYTLTKVDVDRDEALREAHGRSIPVLTVGGRVAFKGRMTAAEFERKFARLARAWREEGEAAG